MEARIYELTNHGLDIIRRYYPEAEPGKKFRMREGERTPSASVKLYNGVYLIKDFGDNTPAMKPIELVMRHEGLNYWQAVNREADRLGLNATKKTFAPRITKTQTTDADGVIHTESGAFTDADLRFWGVNAATLQSYGWAVCEEYTQIKNGTKITVQATDTYRMYVRRCGGFYKIYKPYDALSRFIIEGEKPADYLNGLQELQARHKTMQPDEDGRLPKLDCVIICSGERDAMVAAYHGYCPVWRNSETEKLSRKNFAALTEAASVIINIPDADETGLRCASELAMEYLEVQTAYLPGWLSDYSENGKPRKDLRDFFALKPAKKDFDNLINGAKAAKYWTVYANNQGDLKVRINDLYFVHFLDLLGFCKVVDGNNAERYIYRNGNILQDITITQIKDITQQWLADHGIDMRVRNATFRYLSGQNILNNLQTVEINTVAAGEYYQYFQFSNVQVRVTPEAVTEVAAKKINYWESQVIKHRFRRLPQSFVVGDDMLTIHSQASHFMRYLINTSRIYWREEYEQRATSNEETEREYRAAHKFDLWGDRLARDEQLVQTRNFLNKVYTLGYLMHKYKKKDRAMAVWVMENKVTEINQSNGGSGKSFMFDALKTLLNIMGLNGRDDKLMENKHVLDRVSPDTNLILIEDAQRNFDFDYWYPIITNNLIINEKNKQSKEIPFTDSPKIAITSNFAPQIYNKDASSFRRLQFMVMSDYYHVKSPGSDEYRETRQISSDFGYVIMAEDYREEYYNEDFNFLLDCLQFYLQCCRRGIPKIEADIANILERIGKQNIGDNFEDWADIYFSDEEVFNRDVQKDELIDDYKNETGLPVKSITTFKKKLNIWCEAHGIVINPPDVVSNNTRYRKRVNLKMKEFFYFRKAGEPPAPPKTNGTGELF